MKITQFKNREHQIVSDRVLTALKDLGDELGVDFSTGGGVIGAATGMIKLGISIRDTGAGLGGKETEFRLHAPRYGINPDIFGHTFILRGTVYKVIGLNIGSPKYVIDGERIYDGKSFKFTASVVKSIVVPAKAA